MEVLRAVLNSQFVKIPVCLTVPLRSYARLAEVGRLDAPKITGKYDTGQLILHRVFGYRGVVLFPWLARVYDRDLPQHRSGDVEPNPGVGKEVRGRTHTFYQVLIDQRDCPYIRAQTEAVTFLGNQDSSRSLYAIPGLDYVAHEDIIPYTSAEKSPLHHELFDKFLAYDPDKGDLWEIRKFFSVGRGRHERKPCQLKSLFFQNTNYSVWLCNQQYIPVTSHFCPRSPFRPPRDAQGLAEQKPPLARTIRRSQRNH
jgi:heat shock protein HspQ